MSLTVRQRAEWIATFRYTEVFLMETLARWTPTTPEMEVKVLFGRHIWETAQHADALGKRTYEQRAPMHFTQAPDDQFSSWLDEMATVEGAADRLAAMYDITIPALGKLYDKYLDLTDHLLDAPSVKVIERIRWGVERMTTDVEELREKLPGLRERSDRIASLQKSLEATDRFVVHRRDVAEEASA
ncbi:MAG: hypothetical protein KY459_08985 [Acidobacteria bacterium]|nr:hypothetical protein [Acidobacteriota bacterium]